MAKNLQEGLAKFITADWKSVLTSEKITILSIGCGNNLEIISDEIDSLIACFPNMSLNYTGVDLIIPNAEKINTSIKQKVKTQSCQFNVLEADINKVKGLFNQQPFDFILLRHPQFFDAYDASTREILRITIPSLLKKDGRLLVSLYIEEEKVFMGAKPNTLDAVFLKTVYVNDHYHETSIKNSSRQTTINQLVAFDEQFMYFLTNKINTQTTPQSAFKINSTDPKIKMYIFNLIDKIGGKIINKNEGTFFLWKEYCESLQKELNFTCNQIDSAITTNSISNTSNDNAFFLNKESPHGIVLREINNLNKTPHQASYKTIYQTLTKKNYNQALRQASSENNDFTVNVVTILLAHGKQLNIDPNEHNSKNLSAIDYAKKCQHPKVDELINYAETCAASHGEPKARVSSPW